nr:MULTISPECIES: type VI secretion system protein TssA [unclassified Pseudomonas]
MLSSRYLQIANATIDDINFAGEDLRFSSDFENIESEISKATSLHGTNVVDWTHVREHCEVFIETRSKDLRVMSWLVWSLFECESYHGLVAGMGALRHLCTAHWETLHPQKPRTRVAALNWLFSRLEQASFEHAVINEQLPVFRELSEHLRTLDQHFCTHLGDEAPLLLPLCNRLDDLIERAQRGNPEPSVIESTITHVKQIATRVFSANEPLANEKDALKSLRDIQEQSKPLCTYWLTQKVSDQRALRLSRTLLWLTIETLPEHNADRITSLRGIPSDKLKSYLERFEQAQYTQLLSELEPSLVRAPFWLSGQRLASLSLKALKAEQAAQEVEIQLALLLQRVPGLEELHFHDGTPFADIETKAWIRAHVMPLRKKADTPTQTVQRQTEPGRIGWEQALEESQRLLSSAGLTNAVQHFKENMRQAGLGRERFLWQLAQARLCISAHKYELAKAQLDALDHHLQSAGLRHWEPELNVQVLTLLRHCCELLEPNHALNERKEQVHKLLCHFDLEAVLN